LSRILVTGINGFVGKHLARELKSREHSVLGVGREDSVNNEVATIVSDYFRCDLTDPSDVSTLPIDEIDAVINLAGLARVGDSFKDPDKYNQVNVAVLSVLGSRMIKNKSLARMIAISTGTVYDPDQPMPLTEYSKVTDKGSPYAHSKLLMEKAANELLNRGLDCVIARPLNHIGPGQERGFLVPDLYEKITGSLKSSKPVEVGNLKTRRDYTDVRDVVKAYADLAEAQELTYGLYNVCSSKSVAGEEILERLLELMHADGKVEIKVNADFIRASDPMDLFGSYDRLNQETDWTPTRNIDETLSDFVASKLS